MCAGQTVLTLEVRKALIPESGHTQMIWSVSTANLLIDWETLNGMQADRPSPAMDQQYRATRQHQFPPSHFHFTIAQHNTPRHFTSPLHSPTTSTSPHEHASMTVFTPDVRKHAALGEWSPDPRESCRMYAQPHLTSLSPSLYWDRCLRDIHPPEAPTNAVSPKPS